jgi:hypothetical protein
LSTVIGFASLNEIRGSVHSLAITCPVFVGDGAFGAFCPMTVDLDIVSTRKPRGGVSCPRSLSRTTEVAHRRITYIFPCVWMGPAQFIVVDANNMTILAMQCSHADMLVAGPYLNM